jgi:hypothetical protein
LAFARVVEMEEFCFVLDVCGKEAEDRKKVILEISKNRKNVFCKKEVLAAHKIENEFNQGFAKLK